MLNDVDLSLNRRWFVPALLVATLWLPTSFCWAGFTNNIMLTGYWPPTNEMVRHFSPNPDQNPDGWQGENWEDRGYDIYSFFPEFDPNHMDDPKGSGDFEVDYQDTSEDWWRITAEVNPVAIITFSRGVNDQSWEVEYLQRNLRRQWQFDYEEPFRPTPNPPDDSGVFERPSTLPMEDIVSAVADADLGLTPFVDYTNYGGAFLSEFIAYHGVWYQDLHKEPSDPFRSVAAGHIHVGGQVSVNQGRMATETSLRVLLDYVDAILIPEPAALSWLMLLLVVPALRRPGRM